MIKKNKTIAKKCEDLKKWITDKIDHFSLLIANIKKSNIDNKNFEYFKVDFWTQCLEINPKLCVLFWKNQPKFL